MRISFPQPGPWRRISVAVGASLLAHLGLVALVLLGGYFVPVVIVKKGEPIFVELPKPEEPAPRCKPAPPPRPPPPEPRRRPRPARGGRSPLPRPGGKKPSPSPPFLPPASPRWPS